MSSVSSDDLFNDVRSVCGNVFDDPPSGNTLSGNFSNRCRTPSGVSPKNSRGCVWAGSRGALLLKNETRALLVSVTIELAVGQCFVISIVLNGSRSEIRTNRIGTAS